MTRPIFIAVTSPSVLTASRISVLAWLYIFVQLFFWNLKPCRVLGIHRCSWYTGRFDWLFRFILTVFLGVPNGRSRTVRAPGHSTISINISSQLPMHENRLHADTHLYSHKQRDPSQGLVALSDLPMGFAEGCHLIWFPTVCTSNIYGVVPTPLLKPFLKSFLSQLL